MSVRGATAPVGWLRGVSPRLRPFALLLASCGGVPSGSESSLRDGITLLGRFCLRSRSGRRLFAHLPLRSRCIRLRSSDRYRSRLGRPRSWGDRSRSSDRYRYHRNRSRRDWSRSSDRSRLRRLRAHSPASQEVGVTGCGFTISSPPPVASGHVVGTVPSLPACGLSGQDERSGIFSSNRMLVFSIRDWACFIFMRGDYQEICSSLRLL